MSDYDTDEESPFQYDDDLVEDYGLDDFEPNGHDKDEEDVKQVQLEDEVYDTVEKNIPEEAVEPVDDEDFEEEEETEQKETTKVVPKYMRKTSPYMTKFEYSYLISQRAFMIEHDSPLMLPDTKLIHSIDIAKEETEKGLNPIIIQRVMPNGDIEEWECKELGLPKNFS